ncbi:MAG: XdhC family protein, partial [Bacteroidetes bacterium]
NGKVLGGEPDEELLQAALKAWQQRKSQIIEREAGNYFALVIPRKCQLLIVGAAHISADLVHLARQFDFETIVVDPRGIFSNNTQFLTQPDHKYAKWPEEVLPDLPLDAYTFAVTLTHDPKIDDQALKLLLRSEVAYIGSLGSSRTHAKRLARLHKAGFTEEETSRIHGPIGLDIHAKLPREIALSIMAEIIRIKNQHL